MEDDNFGLRSQINRLEGILAILEDKLSAEIENIEELARTRSSKQKTPQELTWLEKLSELQYLVRAALFKE